MVFLLGNALLLPVILSHQPVHFLGTIIQHLITTPLLLTIVQLTYRDKRVKDLPYLGSEEDQTRQIFANYVQRMLKPHQEDQANSSTRLKRSLIWLAKSMQDQHQTEWYLEWIQPEWFLTRGALRSYWILVSLLTGLIGVLLGGTIGGIMGEIIFGGTGALNGGLRIGLFGGVVFGLIGILNSKQVKISLVEKFVWSWNKSKVGLLIGIPSGVLFGMLSSLIVSLFGGIGGVIPTLRSGLFTGLAGAVVGGLSGMPLYTNLRLKPNQGIDISGRNAFRLGVAMLLVSGPFGGLNFGISAALIAGLSYGILYGLIMGTLFGLLVGLLVGLLLGGNSYLRHYLLRFFLARMGVLPWHAIPLLEEATNHALLQRVGGGYRFVHPLLQEYFATLAAP